MTAPIQRSTQLTETPEQLHEIAQRAKRVSEDLAWLYRRTGDFSQPAWSTGWTQPIAGLLPFAEVCAQWAIKLEALAGP